MKKTMLSITVLLFATILFSCNPDNPDDSTSVKKISIMGDSYSTFEGWSNIDMEGNPNEFWVYYPHEGNTDVTTVEKTWWYMLCQKPEFELEISNSYSGPVVSNTHYNGVDVTDSDLSFMHRVGENAYGVDYNGDPDIILVFGGTNDCWAGVALGDYVYDNWTDADLKCFRPAFSKLLASLQTLYPDATVYSITNRNDDILGLTKPYAKSIEKVCKHYGVTNIVLKDIEKTDGHPTYKGMQSICEQVYEVLK